MQRRPGRACSWPRMEPQEHRNRKRNSRECRLLVPSAESRFTEETNLNRRDLGFSAWVLGEVGHSLLFTHHQSATTKVDSQCPSMFEKPSLRTPRVTSTRNSIGCFPWPPRRHRGTSGKSLVCGNPWRWRKQRLGCSHGDIRGGGLTFIKD